VVCCPLWKQDTIVAMSERQAIDAWAQPVTGRSRQDLPEAVRLLEKSGTARYLDLHSYARGNRGRHGRSRN
jgi:hypothetical protein